MRCLRFGRRAAMIARDVRDHDLLRRRDAEQVGVQDQMVRMLVVPLVADVIARVVQQRGVGERLAILARAAESFAERVEQRQREPLHVRRVRLLDVTALGEFAHRARARLAGIGDRRDDACRLEQQSLADSVARHHDLARFDAAQHLGGDGESGDDDVGALGVESRRRASLVGTHIDEHVRECARARRAECARRAPIAR